MNILETVTFDHKGHTGVCFPVNWGFEPGDEVIFIKVGEAIHILHADASEARKNELLRQAAEVAIGQIVDV